ncbi:hypothetical protein [Photobacterium kagoshimensis]|uniref:hypothetical protein n=1 Tax=Photobacterium kagoshimensis TaxID=2910242 RepID=UPI003D09EB35
MSHYQARKEQARLLRLTCQEESLVNYGTHDAKEAVKLCLERDFPRKEVYHKGHDLIVCHPINELLTLRVYHDGEIAVPDRGTFPNYQQWLTWYKGNSGNLANNER